MLNRGHGGYVSPCFPKKAPISRLLARSSIGAALLLNPMLGKSQVGEGYGARTTARSWNGKVNAEDRESSVLRRAVLGGDCLLDDWEVSASAEDPSLPPLTPESKPETPSNGRCQQRGGKGKTHKTKGGKGSVKILIRTVQMLRNLPCNRFRMQDSTLTT
jgi:hypothetical protein